MRCGATASRGVHIQKTLRRQVPGVRRMGAGASYNAVLRNGLALGRVWLLMDAHAQVSAHKALYLLIALKKLNKIGPLLLLLLAPCQLLL